MTSASRNIIERATGAVLSPIVSGIASFNRWRLPPIDARIRSSPASTSP